MMNALVRSSTSKAAQCTRSIFSQKRGIIDYLTKYPDRVMEIKKIQMKGGTKLGGDNPTWTKQPGDAIPLMFGGALVSFGLVSTIIGHYRMATGTGKLPQ